MQLKARARITLKPLVETIPCLGAVNISLLEVPTVDLALSLLNSPDLMAIPGLNLAVNLGLKMVSRLPWLSCFCNSAFVVQRKKVCRRDLLTCTVYLHVNQAHIHCHTYMCLCVKGKSQAGSPCSL